MLPFLQTCLGLGLSGHRCSYGAAYQETFGRLLCLLSWSSTASCPAAHFPACFVIQSFGAYGAGLPISSFEQHWYCQRQTSMSKRVLADTSTPDSSVALSWIQLQGQLCTFLRTSRMVRIDL